ncbi:DUF3768 domain-containing protein [Acanthopleuribacter pedis]|uniref:DUF3768 domain-containing protein n=1 Tax=Acanthopleuribacter pedis TaxID=442870 RepID=A0A8J7U314_9BACT|nr:DUF3768 domain-containing protein [Acanthopleuribacter pedis]MBO1318314.1 DUF3768 domain-containing protein [Acanthopleuribacter pedis]
MPESPDVLARYALEIFTKILILELDVDPTVGQLSDHLDLHDGEELERAFKCAEIALNNDLLRMHGPQTSRIPGRIVVTRSVGEAGNVDAIVDAVKTFDNFTEGNDPHHQHDFGAFEIDGERYFFKIDYYDKEVTYGVDPMEEEPFRVMTIMRADEY